MRTKRVDKCDPKIILYLKSLYILFGSHVELDLYDAGENIGLDLKYT